jgi:hypothetical protein
MNAPEKFAFVFAYLQIHLVYAALEFSGRRFFVIIAGP